MKEGEKMLYVILKENNSENAYLFNSWECFKNATKCSITMTFILELDTLSGKTYKEKRECLRDKAIEYSNNQVGGLSYLELSCINEYFERYGRRYGLLKEFKENCIC